MMDIRTVEDDAVFLFYSFAYAKHHMERYAAIVQEAQNLDQFIALIERELLKETNNVQ